MQTTNEPTIGSNRRHPWNKGKFIGPKPPLQPRHVWAIRTRLQLDRRIRDLALFNLAIDSKLRGCDVVSLKVEDVAPHGYAIDRASVRQKAIWYFAAPIRRGRRSAIRPRSSPPRKPSEFFAFSRPA